MVVVGDNNSNQVVGYVAGSPVGNAVMVDDGAGTPIDLSDFHPDNGAWIFRASTELQEGHINEDDIKPSIVGAIDEQFFVFGYVEGDSFYKIVNLYKVKYGLTAKRIKSLNPQIKDPNKIQIGELVRIN